MLVGLVSGQLSASAPVPSNGERGGRRACAELDNWALLKKGQAGKRRSRFENEKNKEK